MVKGEEFKNYSFFFFLLTAMAAAAVRASAPMPAAAAFVLGLAPSDFSSAGAAILTANYFPARLSALFMMVACTFCGKDFSARNAVRIFLRDRYNHKSPNSAQTESVMAGALELRLAGPAYYFQKLVQN